MPVRVVVGREFRLLLLELDVLLLDVLELLLELEMMLDASGL